MNLPNRLTIWRLAAVPFFLIFTVVDTVHTRFAAFLIFIGAGVTDLVDGYLARKHNLITKLGVFLDPLADKLIITAAFIAFVEIRDLHIPAWMVVAIVGREFLITGLRALAASQGKIVAADDGGKIKTAVQNMAVITILLQLMVSSALERYWGYTTDELAQMSGWRADAVQVFLWTPYWLVFMATILSVVTGISYLRKNIHLIREDI